MDNGYMIFCRKAYREEFNKMFQYYLGNKTSNSAAKDAEKYAQREAIKNTLRKALDLYSPEVEAANLWRAIRMAHLTRKVEGEFIDLRNPDTHAIDEVISAEQSWKKSSGHAFEEFISDTVNKQCGPKITFILQKDLTSLLNSGKISNDEEDIKWLHTMVKRDVFDLYVIFHDDKDNFVFGCVQSKTSIRDRVSRDREPSIEAMKLSFWSVGVVLDGGFLRMPKFKEMVNGNEYSPKDATSHENGWHGFYVITKEKLPGRIYSDDKDLTLLAHDADEARKSWIRARQRFTLKWKPSRK